MDYRLEGLIAATFTPLDQNGDLELDQVDAMVDHLIEQGVNGLYVCGSTGEGLSLTSTERCAVAERYVRAADGRVPVVVQVGHNSVREARRLAAHAQMMGADAVSATSPSYFKPANVPQLVQTTAEIAAGSPELPFYYYHIPAMTGVSLSMVDYLQHGAEVIPNLVGLKYTSPTVFEFQTCRELNEGRFDMLWGCDEMLLSALSVGAAGAVGSTYNIAASLYRAIIDAFSAGDLTEARQRQWQAAEMVRVILRFPFHAAMKAILRWQGFNLGPCRLPLAQLSDDQSADLRTSLDAIGFSDWSGVPWRT